MNILDKLLTPGNTHGRTGQALTPRGVAVHYVGNAGSTVLANRNWFENGAGGAYTSAHYIIGLDGEILCCIPETERAQHAGKSYGAAWNEMAKTNNGRYIGIECCHPDASGKFNDKTYTALITLLADICKRYGFDPHKDVVRHYDITGKSCPLYYVNNSAAWAQLVKDVSTVLSDGGTPLSLDTTNPQIGTVKLNLFSQRTVEVPGVLISGTNYVGIRGIMDALALGYRIGWDGKTQSVLIDLSDGVGTVLSDDGAPLSVDTPNTQIGTVKLKLFGQRTVEVPGVLISGTNYVSIRGILDALALGYRIDWDGKTQSVLINLPE